jgi:hypothetical protein
MALVNSDLYNEQNETYLRTVAEGGNTDLVRLETYKIALQSETAVTTSDDILLFDLPVGSIVRPELCSKHIDFSLDSTCSSVTFSLGDSADDNRYSVSDVHAAAGETPFVVTTVQPDGLLNPFTITEATKTLQLALTALTGTWAAGENVGFINVVVELP